MLLLPALNWGRCFRAWYIWTASSELVLIRTSAARSYKQWVKRNLQTERQIPGPSEWLDMRNWNLSWWNARRHKFAWRAHIQETYNYDKTIFECSKNDSLSLQVRSVSAFKSDQSQPSSQISLSLQVRSLRFITRVATLMQKQNSLTFHWLFPDQIQIFTDQNTAVLWPISLLTADKGQIPFTSSLKCTSLILQMKQIKSSNTFLAQNVLKLASFHSFKWAREKINTFCPFQVVKIPATTHILGQNYGIPWLFPDILGI